MVARRLSWQLEKDHAFTPAQTGFRADLSTSNSLLMITHDLEAAKQPGGLGILLLMDVKKAFDNAPPTTIIHLLIEMGVGGRLSRFLEGFLLGRSYKVWVGEEFSTSRPLERGVPQGAVLSPIRFNVLMADLPRALRKVPWLRTTIYADDVTLWTTKGDVITQQRTIQQGMDITL